MRSGLFGSLLLATWSCTGTITAGDERDPGHTGADAGLFASDSGLSVTDNALTPGFRWDEKAERVMDSTTLAAAFAASGYQPPTGSIVYAARVQRGVDVPAYALFDYGAGAFDQQFWPASTIKLISAVGALDFVGTLGFTSAANVTYAGAGSLGTLRSIIQSSLEVSSNIAYTRTLQIAGYERINNEFLSEENGFPTLILQRSYERGVSVRDVPAMTFTEGSLSMTVPARSSSVDFGCSSDGAPLGNCASLFELVEGARRVLLHDEIPESERFALATADVQMLRSSMETAYSAFSSGAAAALGAVEIFNKPGWVGLAGYHYLDHGLISVPATGERFLLAAVIPFNECGGHNGCISQLSAIAQHALSAIRDAPAFALQPDAGTPITIEARTSAGQAQLTVAAQAASTLEIYIDGERVAEVMGGPVFEAGFAAPASGPTLVTIVALDAAGEPVGYRSAAFDL